MTTAPPFEVPHRRRNPLTGEWVLVSAHRVARPWQGQHESPASEERPVYDPGCYLCPGNTRASGATNPHYATTYAFPNDFPALVPDVGPVAPSPAPLFRSEPQAGTCRVLCFSPRHDLDLGELATDALVAVVDMWAEQTAELGRTYRWVQVFENRGEAMGASNPHPHGQVWAGTALPNVAVAEDRHQAAYLAEHGRPLLLDYADAEAADGVRAVVDNGEWLAVVPYWAVWPYETLLVPRRPVARLPDLDGAARTALADLLQRLLARYDNLFEHPFPYSMGWHGAPFHDEPADHWQLHAHVYPPLLRSATVRKFMVGYELLAEVQRDLTAEQAAERLRTQSEVDYRVRAGTGAG